MREKRWTAAFTLIIVFAILSPPSFASSEPLVSDVEIKIPGESLVFSGDVPVIVRGIIHNMSFSISPFSGSVILELRYGIAGGASFNDTTNYQWSFNSTSGDWVDELYGRYIIPEDCGVYGNSLSFHVGLSTSAYTGTWFLSVSLDGVQIYNTTVDVRDYSVGLAVQSVNTVFTISPFSSESKTSEYHIRVENKGNIPLKLSVLFGDYQPLFMVTNITEPLHVGEKRDLYVTLNSIPWSPRVVNITGVVHPAVPNYLVSPGTVSFATVADQTFNLRIEVVRPGYNLVRIGNTMVQYRETIAANYGKAVTVDMYLSAINSTGTTTVSISADLLTLSSIMVDNESSGQDITLQLSNNSESHLAIIVEPVKPSSTAYLNYDIRDAVTSDRKVISTEIVVGVALNPESGNGLILLILISMAGLFIISIIFITFIHFRKEGQRKEVKTSSKTKRRKRKM